MSIFAASTPLEGNCFNSGCNLTENITGQTDWDVFNPALFLISNETLCQYANTTSCCHLNNSNFFFQFLQPFCIDLLPFCIFYSFIRVIVSVLNYTFIYRKRIGFRLERSREALLNESSKNQSKQNYISYFDSLLKTSFILDIFSAVSSLWIFKGYQYYASQFSAPNLDSNYALLGNYNAPGDFLRVLILFIGVLVWFFIECWKTYIQIFSVSSLTHLDNLKKETLRNQEQVFYKKHKKFALWWTITFFIVGITLLIPNFFWKHWQADDVDRRDNFETYKLFYKYYSAGTVSFWLSYALIYILILTDRILAYDGFKKRQVFREKQRQRESMGGSTALIGLQHYQVQDESRVFNDMAQVVRRKFPEKSEQQVEEMTQKITNIYNDKMKNHYFSLKDKMKYEIDDVEEIETSMDYVRYLRWFNILNLIGYAFILFSYQRLSDAKAKHPHDASSEFEFLPLYLFGFIISSFGTFAFELTHNYVLYRSYFLQVLAKMKKLED